MPNSLITVGKVYEDKPCWLIGRLCAVEASGSQSPRPKEGKLVTQGDITGSTLTVKAYDENGNQIGSTQTPNKTSIIFDTLQTGGVWDNIQGGGNLLYQAPASFFPTGGARVRIEMFCTLTDNVSQPTGIWDVDVEPVSHS